MFVLDQVFQKAVADEPVCRQWVGSAYGTCLVLYFWAGVSPSSLLESSQTDS